MILVIERQLVTLVTSVCYAPARVVHPGSGYGMILQCIRGKEKRMSLVCKTLVLIDNAETLKLVAQAFPHPKYELEFIDTLEEASARAISGRMDLFIIDSKFADDSRIDSLRSCMPTLFVEPEYVRTDATGSDTAEESDRMRNAAEKLLRKNYIGWIIDALEYSS